MVTAVYMYISLWFALLEWIITDLNTVIVLPFSVVIPVAINFTVIALIRHTYTGLIFPLELGIDYRIFHMIWLLYLTYELSAISLRIRTVFVFRRFDSLTVIYGSDTSMV